MTATFALTVRDKERAFFEGKVASVVLPGGKGAFGILAHHTSLVSTLEPGMLTITEASGKTLRFSIGPGIVETGRNRTTLFLDSLPEEITDK